MGDSSVGKESVIQAREPNPATLINAENIGSLHAEEWNGNSYVLRVQSPPILAE